MKCPACNSEIASHSDSCTHCGAPAYLAVATQNTTLEHCTYCGTREDANLTRCSNCGLKRGFKVQEAPVGNCANCGGSWRDTWLYCRTCGIIRKQGFIEVVAPLSISFQALKNYPVTTLGVPAVRRQERFVESGLARIQRKQEEEFKETSFSSDEFEVTANDPVFYAPMLTETEVVGRMFANEGQDEHYVNDFEEPEKTAEPSIVVYDLQKEKTHDVITEKTIASPAPPITTVQENNSDVSNVASVIADPDLNLMNPLSLPAKIAIPEIGTPDVRMDNKPVQAVRPSKKARGGTPPPIDTFLVKLIAFLIGFVLLFAGLIVSGFKIRDLFSKAPATVVVKAPAVSAMPVKQLSEASQAPPEIEGMVYIPGGEFMMGEDKDPVTEMSSPAHKVSVQPFFIDRTEVTNTAYAAFVKAAKYPAPTNWKDGNFPKGTNNFPVVNVGWNDANAYAKWAGKRLPTETEWEFAARSNDGRIYPWGTNWLDNASNTKETGHNKTVEVGLYAVGASPFGVLDMAGNVWEWTLSDVISYRDPEIVIASGKVIRGGAFSLPNDRAKATYRGYNQPEAKTEALGFRCVKDL